MNLETVKDLIKKWADKSEEPIDPVNPQTEEEKMDLAKQEGFKMGLRRAADDLRDLMRIFAD